MFGKASGNTKYYYYNFLNSREKSAYDKILQGYRDMQKEIELEMDKDGLRKLQAMVYYDHPELFWVDSSYDFTLYTGEKKKVVLKPRYNCSERTKIQREAQILECTNEIVHEVIWQSSEYKKVQKVFEYLIDMIDYVAGAPDNQNIYSSLVKKKTVCAGYARATQYLLQRAGMMVLYVSGNLHGRGPHAWNIVKCNGHFYQVDTTFGDINFTDPGLKKSLEGQGVIIRGYEYLCCTDRMMYRDRSPEKTKLLPKCRKKDCNYYKQNRRYFKRYSKAVEKSLKDSVRSGKHFWECQFSNKSAYKKMCSKLNEKLYAKIVLENTDCRSVVTHSSKIDESYIIRLWY